ncbi:DUF4190 domain-containing protein [bacterium]|nr:DUF4190 domain-containing protein [bacterium]
MEETPQVQPQMNTTLAIKPHRGSAVLALGIIGIVLCFITGIIAWVMGKNDLAEMAQGLRDPEGEGMTRAGMICGIIAVALSAIGILWWLVAVFIIGTAGFMEAAGM